MRLELKIFIIMLIVLTTIYATISVCSVWYIVTIICEFVRFIYPHSSRFVQSRSALFLGRADLHNLPNAVWRFCVDHSCEPSQYAKIPPKSANHTNQYPACNVWKYCSVLTSSAFSEGDVEHHWSVTRSNSLTQGLPGHLMKTITSK